MADDDTNARLSPRRIATCSALCPGWGHWVAGERKRGVILIVLLHAVGFWALWAVLGLGGSVQERLSTMMSVRASSSPPSSMPELGSIVFFLLPFLLLELLWFYAIADSLALVHRRNLAGKHDTTAHPWMVFLSTFFSPGAGHLYGGIEGRGWIFVGAYALAKMLQIPMVAETISTLGNAIGSGGMSNPSQLQGLADQARALDFSMASFLLTLVWSLACLDALQGNRENWAKDWDRRPRSLFLGAVASWYCPGSAQLYAGRDREGWIFAIATLGLGGLRCLAGAGFIGSMAVGLSSLLGLVALGHGLWILKEDEKARNDETGLVSETC